MTRRFLPGATIGLMGSGQLGRMFAIAARRMGYRVHTFSPDYDTPTGQVADVEVSDEGVVRLVAVWAVIDPGFVINPEGVRNQVEGGIQQSASWPKCSRSSELRASGRSMVMVTTWPSFS